MALIFPILNGFKISLNGPVYFLCYLFKFFNVICEDSGECEGRDHKYVDIPEGEKRPKIC